VGLVTVTDAAVLIAEVAVPRRAICEYTILLLSTKASKIIAFEIIAAPLEKCRSDFITLVI